MEILQLKYFCDACETENFSKTAEKFLVPPSNISQCVKRLEKELNTVLFNRSANRIVLNEQGRKFYEKTKKALELLEEAEREMLDDGISGKIRISIISNRRIVMKAIEKFRKLYPEVIMEISHSFSGDFNDYDLIITDEILKAKELKSELILSEKIFLAVKQGSELSKKERVTAHDIKNENFISMNKGSSLYYILKRICSRLDFEPNVVIQSDDPFYVRKCVELGLGITFVPVLSWKGQFNEGISVKNAGDFERITYAYWNDGKYMAGCTKKFLAMLMEECKAESV